MKTLGMECPECGGLKTRVRNSNLDVEGNRVRARQCDECAHVFSTVEVYLPGLSHARTQRSKEPKARISRPQYVLVRVNDHNTTLTVVEPERSPVCRAGLHPWTKENLVYSRQGKATCLLCRRDSARELYHHTQRNAPPSLREETRKRWREAKRAQDAKRRAA